MRRNVAASRMSARRLTWLVLAGVACLAVGSYGYHLFRLYQQWQRDTPQPQVERLISDLRRYHSLMKRFPADFHEINARLWHTKPQPNYGTNGREARVKNYLYRYTQVEAGKCVLWAVPTGPQRGLAAAHFIVITPAWMHGWRGPALTDEADAALPDVPTPQELMKLQMSEMPARAVAVP